ncbi:MAG: response regulator [Lachnospiraceae bacterium]|nr:response regulator [Lachnospiraceae bacterium]
MGNQLVWQDRFNIGVDIIDKEHKKLFSIVNKLFSHSDQAAKRQWVCEEGIKYFKDHAMKHFAEEEAYMASISYPGFETHRNIHKYFRTNTLPALERELNRSMFSQDAVNHFLGVCAGWLIGHTLTEDRAITGKITSKWSNLRPEEEQLAMKQLITQLLNDMFQLNASLVSECYGGEKFGSGIYYRIVYTNEKGRNWEIILVFEEKLLINTIGKLMDEDAGTLSVLIVNATRYAARQFVERIKEHIPSSELYKLKGENLLTYDQFQQVFNSQHPQYSLLFDTGAGYFAYCVIAPHMQENEAVSFLKTENVMTEIQKYLTKNEQTNKNNHKKKILVVDDSEMLQQFMKKLLGIDYQVSLANSGLSAIRAITLNRPDLILLDYEMPVCDGAQVLEMIRSEKDFADIPVIFLTGRSDKEAVNKMMSLKPKGCLLKSMKPAEIKKSIDDYFKKATAR